MNSFKGSGRRPFQPMKKIKKKKKKKIDAIMDLLF